MFKRESGFKLDSIATWYSGWFQDSDEGCAQNGLKWIWTKHYCELCNSSKLIMQNIKITYA